MRFKVLVMSCFFLTCCRNNHQEQLLFETLEASETGISFQNSITEDETINVIDFQYCYNGGGVAIGDFNNDGLPDIVFSGNQVSSKIYLNEGDFRFKDVTEIARLETNQWITGVVVVDVNSDGLDDIYFNVGGANCQGDCQNLLFVNEGFQTDENIPRFKEQAAEYGLDEPEYAQQTVFFDFDRDDDLDAFILRNGNVQFDKNSPMPKRYFPANLSDVLLENVEKEGVSHPVFVDVSEKYGIQEKGFGLGLGINDFDNDGWVDIYVGNDFITNDLLYLNRTQDSVNPHFSEGNAEYFKHQTYNSMGLDIADVNNDSRPDLMVLDMLPNNYRRQKMMMGAMNYDKYQLALRNGYTPQFMRNTLHINQGELKSQPVKSQEMAFLTKTAQTDWSWAPLLADFDGDGKKDVFVTNGYGKDITDLDFINYNKQNNVFGTDETRDARLKELVSDLPPVRLTNFFFKNGNELNFEDVSQKWSDQPASLSNGAAYADLDNDGDLDIIVNNIDRPAYILKNNSAEKGDFQYLNVKLEGPKKNKNGIGAKISIWTKKGIQTHFQSTVKGYLSSAQPGAFFGIEKQTVDSLEVVWPSGLTTKLKDLSANQTLVVDHSSALESGVEKNQKKHLFDAVEGILSFKHSENSSNDFIYQQLLLTQHSKSGPCLASDGGSIIFIGGSHGQPGRIYDQDRNGKFNLIQKLDSKYEDSDAAFFDVDQDGDMDLYVSSGGSEHSIESPLFEDRLYINQGDNIFERSSRISPKFLTSTSCVRPFDYDKDGDLDVFVGSGMLPRQYPKAPKNHLLINQDGKLTKTSPASFDKLGMIKDAIWQDIDNDGWHDLILAGDWKPITVIKNQEGTLKSQEIETTDANGSSVNTSGWWKSISAGDFDQDGDIDFILGNQGENNFVNPSQEYPLYIYTQDLDENGSVDPVVGAYYDEGDTKKLLPLHSRDDIMKQVVSLKNRYTSYSDFTTVGFKELLSIENLEEETLVVEISTSIYLENRGDFKFRVHHLPKQSQVAPVNDILVSDVDSDGHLDALLVGNDFSAESHFGRYDAFNGLFLKGDGKGGFEAVPTAESGFYVPGQSNSILKITDHDKNPLILAGQNNDELRVFKINKK